MTSPVDSLATEEFKYLTKEMIHNREKQSQLFTYGLLSSAALFGFAATSLESLSSVVFLLPIIVLVPITMIVLSLRTVIMRIEAYLRIDAIHSQESQRYTYYISGFKWPNQTLAYVPVFQLMVQTNLLLCVVCVAFTLGLPLFSKEDIGILTYLLVGLSLLPTGFSLYYWRAANKVCAPGRLEQSWKTRIADENAT